MQRKEDVMSQSRKKARILRIYKKRIGKRCALLYCLYSHPAPDLQRCAGDGKIFCMTVTPIPPSCRRFSKARLYDVTRSRREAERIFGLISRGGVTPTVICEIVEDLIGSPDDTL